MAGILAGLVLVGLGVAWAQERVTLTAPDVVTNTGFAVERIILDAAAAMVEIQLVGDQGQSVVCRYGPTTTPTGATLLAALNKANLSSAYAGNASTGSLKQRIYHRLVVMDEAPAVCGRSMAGSITGSVP